MGGEKIRGIKGHRVSLHMNAESRVNLTLMAAVQRVVARKYAVDARDLKGHQRTISISMPRQVAMYLSCEMTGLSPADIGRAFGGKDRQTVLRASRKIEKQIGGNPFFGGLVNQLQAKIKATASAK